jgi:hypothetical protein
VIVGSEYDGLDLHNHLFVPAMGSIGMNGGIGYGPPNTVKSGMATGDIVYVSGGRSGGLAPGSLFTVVGPGRAIVHPLRQEVIGRYYRYLGRLRILSVQETSAIAEIVYTCDAILVGASLTPFDPVPVPLGRSTPMRPVNFPAPAEKLQGAPSIVYAKDDILALAADHVVHIDLGEQDATPGDMYTIYRENRPGLPPIVLGELAVLSVHRRFSVAKIIESRYPIHLGDRLDPK